MGTGATEQQPRRGRQSPPQICPESTPHVRQWLPASHKNYPGNRKSCRFQSPGARLQSHRLAWGPGCGVVTVGTQAVLGSGLPGHSGETLPWAQMKTEATDKLRWNSLQKIKYSLANELGDVRRSWKLLERSVLSTMLPKCSGDCYVYHQLQGRLEKRWKTNLSRGTRLLEDESVVRTLKK